MLQQETANESQANKMLSLERKVKSLSDCIDELENRISTSSTCLRIWRGGNALNFFEPWLLDYLDMDADGG